MTLVAELAAARGALKAAGIEPFAPSAVDEVPSRYRELFGFVVREAVTNVVRHSAARTCTVRVGPTRIEVTDDGRGADGAFSEPDGHGLAGLRERVAAAGGTLSAGPLPGRGFGLCVEMPPP